MIELIPAIDLINGQCVRLTKGDYDQNKFFFNDTATTEIYTLSLNDALPIGWRKT